MMKMSPLSFWSLLALPLSQANAQTSYSCATYVAHTIATPVELTGLETSAGASTTIKLANTDAAGKLCTLFTVQLSESGDQSFYIPVGRSYDGYDWERVAGRYDTLPFDCTAADGTCTVTLPNTDAQPYYLTGYLHALTDDQISARFFEKATFGPTSALLNLATNEADMAVWIQDQFDEAVTPMSSHREYFRKRLNPRSIEIYKYGRAGPHPCKENSRWRKFAFTRKDATMSTYHNMYWPSTPHNATLGSATVDSVEKFIWRFGGHVRTVLAARPKWANDTEIEDGSYPICRADNMPGSSFATEEDRYLYAALQLKDEGFNPSICVHVMGGNPDVMIDPDYLADENDGTGAYIVDFSSSSAKLTEIGHQKPEAVVLFTDDTFYSSNTATCAALPDPSKADGRSTGWIYSPYYEGLNHPDWNPSTRDYLEPPVYAKLPSGSYNIHDMRLTLDENTPSNHMADGGGTQTLESVFKDINSRDEEGNIVDLDLLVVDSDGNPRTSSSISGSEQAIFCSNNRPNIFNEEKCTLSTEPNACVREGIDDEDTVVVMTLKPAALAKINDYVSANTYILGGDDFTPQDSNLTMIHGLEFTENTQLPCEVGTRSRWMKMEAQSGTNGDKSNCDALGGAVSVDATTTYSAFKNLLYYSVADNAYLRDVTMYEQFTGMGCTTADENKTGFAIYVDGESTCYLNVHPEEMNVYTVQDDNANQFASSGALLWATSTDESLNMTTWESKDSADYTYLGRAGDVKILEIFMNELGIYSEAGGLDTTSRPTNRPSVSPSYMPSESAMPTLTDMPTETPSLEPSSSSIPSGTPSTDPSMSPSLSAFPSSVPSLSSQPSVADGMPSDIPSSLPSTVPSSLPSTSNDPSESPSSLPSSVPSTSSVPSDAPSTSSVPSIAPSTSQHPSSVPSTSFEPSGSPSLSAEPSKGPSIGPSSNPTESFAPSDIPSMSSVPSSEPTQLSHVARFINDNVFDTIINDPDIAYTILETQLTQQTGGVLVCGSDGEIASDPIEDDYFDYWNRRLDSSGREGEQKKTVWTKLALSADDQLRQRVAFALSQIFAVSPVFLTYPSLSEQHLFYYDLFVRNAQNTYRDVLKNIAFSINMGRQLSHVGSASVRTSMDAQNKMRFPDENYAREVMQLETVGLEMLNMDGTVIKDSMGIPVPTYDINDILTFARVWTAFTVAPRRANNEELDQIEYSRMDPMELRDIDRRDWFPKKDLLDGWLGDRYPLCYDLPNQAFLKTGATYKLLGRSSQPRYQHDAAWWDGDESIKRMTLHTDSNLYSLLCAESGGSCTFPSVVNLASDIVCHGLECNLDTIRVVQVAPNVFYEYVRRPCVHFSFFNGAKKVFAGNTGISMCAHPSQPVASQTCCPGGGKSEISCHYHGEYVTFNTNNERCLGDICPESTYRIAECGECCAQKSYSFRSPKENHFHWTDGNCSFQLKVRIDGLAAIVHEPSSSSNVIMYVSNTVRNMNYIHLPWPKDPFLGDELFPHIDNQCGDGTCIEQEDWTCLCNVTVSDSAVFTSEPADAGSILSKLKVGAFKPELLGSDYDTPVTHSSDTTISIYHLKTDSGFSESTIFKLPDEFGNDIYLKNLDSTITIGDPGNSYFVPPIRAPLTMRNPLSFYDLVDPEIRDAHYETEALFDHLISHPNTAPFISKRLIQHLGISNPSPRFVETVSSAFKTGTYTTSNGITFGGGKLSDLKATVAAILLDREATSTSLDADPSYGAIREPIVKVLAFMRAMGYVQTEHDRNIYPKLSGMVAKVGQMAHESPDQFSFFLPDYQPPGQFAQSMLNTPPAQVLTLSTTISTVEGFFSLVRNGLTNHDGGFGTSNWDGLPSEAGDTSRSVGYLDFTPSGTNSDEKVARIADLLTSGRLSSDALAKVVEAFDAQSSDATKIRVAQQLIATSPEFHTTNLVSRTTNDRLPSSIGPRTEDPYQAIIVLHLSGGMDSFNVLAPHNSCSSLYRSYQKNREVLALLPEEMLSIANGDSDQPCDDFGVNYQIPIFKELYDNKQGVFMANIGHLAKPVTLNNWFTETRTHLFSHTTMEREAQLVDAFQEGGWSTGVLGRMLDVHQRNGLSVVANGIDVKGPIIEGDPSLGRTVEVIPSSGVNTLSRRSLTDDNPDLASIEPLMSYLNKDTSINSGIFANYWAQNLIDTINRTEYLSALYAATTLQHDNLFKGNVGRKLSAVSKMMINHEERSVNRDVFYLNLGGFDGHALSKDILQSNLPTVNEGITAFYKEMVHQNLFDNVTFVVMSEFGRTITPNSGLGSDHAWGGNSFVFGGQVDGGKILGHYPESFDNTDPTNMGRGRLIPAISWESQWYGIANWFGITKASEIDYVLPNNGNFGCQLYTDKDMYVGGNNTVSGCNDRTVNLKLSMFLSEPRYLTGLEQKKICKAAISQVAKKANVTSRCIVVDQKVIVSYDNVRRQLLSQFNKTRLLEDPTLTYEVVGTVAMDYAEDSVNKTGSTYIENVEEFTKDMSESLTGNCTVASDTCGDFKLDLVSQVNTFEADVTDAPSLSPSVSLEPSDLPSSSPSDAPSRKPSASPSDVPSFQPSISSQPSDSPSGAPSFEPSVSSQPSLGPTEAPSKFPSTSPSDVPTKVPSVAPSDVPSKSPSDAPSNVPSTSPSKAPSATPSDSPSSIPSFGPSVSSMPTPDEPSGKPSSQPSSRPSRDCPDVPESCANGGLWSPYTCECLCLAPYCPDQTRDGKCVTKICSASYHENLFQDCTLGCPWFKYDSSCASGEVVPPNGVTAIYHTKEDCCSAEYPNDISGCIARASGFSVLKYNGRVTVSGIKCSTSGSDKAAAAKDIADVALPIICSGLGCSQFDKMKVTNICGKVVDAEARNSINSSTTLRRLQGSNNDIVEFTLLFYAINQDDLAQIDAVLNQYFKGAALATLMNLIKDEILASTETQTLASITAMGYEFLNSFINGLGLYYPAWGNMDTCLNDGEQQEYMNTNPSAWLYTTLEACCERYFSWAITDCLKLNAEATIVSSSGVVPIVVLPTSSLFYPDWGKTDTCINDGNAPQYMVEQFGTWMYESLSECCDAYYGWDGAKSKCLASGGAIIPTNPQTSESWYVEWVGFKCVKSCEGPSPCGGTKKPWDIHHPSKSVCCKEHLSWKVDCLTA